MAFPIAAVSTIAQLVFQAVPLAERLISGKGRGKEKQTAVRKFVKDELETIAKADAGSLPDFKNFNWLGAIMDLPNLYKLVDGVIDSVVALMNGLAKYNRDEPPMPAPLIEPVKLN